MTSSCGASAFIVGWRIRAIRTGSAAASTKAPSSVSATGDPVSQSDAFSQRFPDLVQHVSRGAKLFKDSCGRCHVPGNAGLWTNEDMQPISAAGGSEPVGRFFSPTIWQRRTQAIRTAILQNLFWMQQRGLLSDGHIVSDAPDNINGLDLLVRPERCQAPTGPDGSVDLALASDLYKKLYTIRQGSDHSFRIPSAGMRFEFYTRFAATRPACFSRFSRRMPIAASERKKTGSSRATPTSPRWLMAITTGTTKRCAASTAFSNLGSIPRTRKVVDASAACRPRRTPGACPTAHHRRT